MTQASSRITIHVTADDIWQVISDFGAAGQYLAGVVDCTVEGEGIGALRTLTSADGSAIVERLETLDEDAHRLSYALLTETPFRNCLTTMELRDLGQGQCEVTWAATFEADGLPECEAQEMLQGALELNGRALQRFIDADSPI
jgi:hypothetical protein